MKKWILGAAAAALLPHFSSSRISRRDEFFWLSEINKASCIINTEEACSRRRWVSALPKESLPSSPTAIKKTVLGPSRSSNYEPYLIKEVGMDATMLHIGRSSQDMHATYRTAIIRDNTLDSFRDAHQRNGSFGIRSPKTIRQRSCPNYTNGVAAQPNSYAHYLMGYQSSLLARSGKNPRFYSASITVRWAPPF